jgi:hypothetical protein
MSTPISAAMTSALSWLTPGIVLRILIAVRKGSMLASTSWSI